MDQKKRKPLMIKERFTSTLGVISHIYYNATNDGLSFGLNFAPDFKLNSVNDRDFSFSIGSQASFGINTIKASSENKESSLLILDLPLFLNFNFGHLASRLFRKKQGVVFGLGYDFVSLQNSTQKGLIFNAGFRSWIGKKSLTLRYTGTFSSSITYYNIHSISLNLTLGKFIRIAKRNNIILDFMDPIR